MSKTLNKFTCNFFKAYLLFFVMFLPLYAQTVQPDKVSLQLEWKHQFEFAGFYAALEQGYYKEVNLDVEIKEYQSDIDTVSDVINGITTYGMSSSQLILERLSGKKIVQLASYFKQNALVLITHPSIHTVADLRNKKVMAAHKELENTSLAALFQEHQLGLDEIEVVPHTFTIDAFVKGEVDAMTAFVSNQPYLLDKNGTAYNIINPAEEGIYSYDVELFTSEEEAANYPDRTADFIRATRKGWEYALSHQEEIVDLIYRFYSKEKTKEALLYEARMIARLMKTDLFQIGAVVPELIELNTNMYVQLGMAEKNWNLEGFVFDNQPKQTMFTQEELDFIHTHPVIRFSDVEWAPFAKIDAEGYSGIFKEYYALLEQRSGIKFEFVKIGDGINFQQVLDALKHKEIDMIDGSGKTQSRSDYALFAGPLMRVSLAIVSTAANKITSLHELKNKKIAVAKGSTASEYLKESYPNQHLIYTQSIGEALEKVYNEEADAMLDNSVVLDTLMKQHPHANELTFVDMDDYEFNIYALIRDDYSILQKIITKAIKSITQEELLNIHYKLLKATMQPNSKRRYHFNEEELQYLKEKKTVTVCIDPNYVPLDSLKDGKQYGINKSFISIAEEALQLPVTIVPTRDWTHSLALAEERLCDVLSMAAPTQERRKFLNFTSPYLETPLVLATRLDRPSLVDLHTAQKLKVAVVKNYALNDIVQNQYKNFEIVTVESVEDGLGRVQNGELDAFADTLMTIGYHLQERYSSALKISGTFDEKLRLGFGIRNDDMLLYNIFQKIVDGISDEEKQNILNQWFAVTYEKGFDYTLFWKLIAAAVVIVLLLIYRQYNLHVMNQGLQQKVEEELFKSRNKDNIIFHQKKLAAMGEMIENIAHQWRQPLSQVNTAVMVLDGLLEHKKIHDNAIEEKLLEIESLTKYMSSTIDDFKNFFAPDKEKIGFSVKQIIEKTLFIIKPAFKHHNIHVDVRGMSEIILEGHPNELQQALLVILNNAKDVLVTRSIQNPKITLSMFSTEDELVIEVCDNAGGVDDNIIDKIFEPYFTTKESSDGTGLGLYISKMIIAQNMQGHLRVVNNDEGACFSIVIPKNVQT